jgi:hypothetical protein
MENRIMQSVATAIDGSRFTRSCQSGILPSRILALTVLCSVVLGVASSKAGAQDLSRARRANNTPIIVQPQFGGQIIGYTVDPSGTEGLLSEYLPEAGGAEQLVATETFDQTTGAITVVVEQNHAPLSTDYVTMEINAPDLGLVLFQESGQNNFLTLNPLTGNQFNGTWTPTLMSGYGIENISVAQGANVAVFANNLDAGNSYVFSSNIAENTFGAPMSLASIIDGDEFLVDPQIAFDSATNQAVLADSSDCPVIGDPACTSKIAVVNLATGDITEFDDKLGTGQLNGIAVDPGTGIAVTTTLADMGVEFYHLKTKKGHEVIIPGATSEIQAGEDVEFDPIHKLFLVSQYTSTGDVNNLQPRIYVYDEAGKVVETIPLQGNIGIGERIALNPTTRTGFAPLVAEPQGLFSELQSFSY